MACTFSSFAPGLSLEVNSTYERALVTVYARACVAAATHSTPRHVAHTNLVQVPPHSNLVHRPLHRVCGSVWLCAGCTRRCCGSGRLHATLAASPAGPLQSRLQQWRPSSWSSTEPSHRACARAALVQLLGSGCGPATAHQLAERSLRAQQVGPNSDSGC